MAKKIAIKIDVDTKRGYDEGVPRMLDVFKQENIKATFFFSMGTDNSGKAICRIFRKGFLTKMLRTKAPSTYGFKNYDVRYNFACASYRRTKSYAISSCY